MIFARLIFVSCPPCEFHLVTRTVLPKVEKQIALADIIMIMKRGILDDVDDLSVYVDGGMIKKHLKTCPAPRRNQPRGKGATSMQIRRL